MPYYIAPSLGGGAITHGDLLLRADHSFALGFSGEIGVLTEGRWRRLADSELQLTVQSNQPGSADRDWPGTLAGDSVVLSTLAEPNLQLVFRRGALASVPVTSGTYIMVSMNGRADLSFEPLLINQRVLYDSITFSDGVFFRRHRAEGGVRFLPSGDSLWAGSSFVTHGSYDGGDGILVLRDYAAHHPSFMFRALDSLALRQDTLVRRTHLRQPTGEGFFIWEDVYQRRR